jgi:hypothetical protein
MRCKQCACVCLCLCLCRCRCVTRMQHCVCLRTRRIPFTLSSLSTLALAQACFLGWNAAASLDGTPRPTSRRVSRRKTPGCAKKSRIPAFKNRVSRRKKQTPYPGGKTPRYAYPGARIPAHAPSLNRAPRYGANGRRQTSKEACSGPRCRRGHTHTHTHLITLALITNVNGLNDHDPTRRHVHRPV